MIELQYITMDTNSWINTGIKANPQSVIYAKLSPQSVAASIDWATFWGANSSDDAIDTYQLRQAGLPTGTTGEWKPQIGNAWRTGRVGTIVYGDDYEITFDVPNSLVTINNDNYTGSQCSWGSPAANPTYPIYVGANNRANSGYRASGAKWYAFHIIQSGVKVIDLVPAIDENNVVCFYDKVSGNYFYNAGSGTFTAGPAVSSISATPSKYVLAATGETINIVVDCENAWEVSGNDWLTLSSTGDTGSTTITATAPSYTGATNRDDTLTFTDSVTGDEAEITITQKKYMDGQPMYLGADEISEMYLGLDSISEAYLGDVLVFSSNAAPSDPSDPCEGMSEEECECVSNGGTWIIPEIGDPYCEQGGDDDCEGDPECLCTQGGGTWTYDEAMDIYYCDCGGDPECECISAGGEWDGTDCIYPEPEDPEY